MTKFSINNVCFEVSEPNNKLKKMLIEDECDIVEIPEVTPSGEKILSLGNHFFANSGRCNTIIIPPTISLVDSGAFAFSNVKNVVWSSRCCYIPNACFYKSSLESIDNISKVIFVDPSAFACSKIKSIRWPDCCHDIPRQCFLSSSLEEIFNVGHVSSVGDAAFMDLKHIKELDFSSVLTCSFSACAFSQTDKEKIRLPYYGLQDLKI